MAKWQKGEERNRASKVSDITLYSVNVLLRSVGYPSLSANSAQSLGLRARNDIPSDKRLSFSHRGHSDCNGVAYEIINVIGTTTKA